MSAYRISMIPYANMGPYRVLGAPRGCEFVDIPPRRSTQALLRGEVLAAAMPVGDWPMARDAVEFLGEFGIAVSGAVDSVLFFSDLPFEQMARPARVRLTAESSSSVRLLFLLLGAKFGFNRLPYRVGEDEPAQGELLIGDAALLHAPHTDRPHVTDLAAEWRDTRGLPFVFARWVIRRDAPAPAKEAMRDWLAEFAVREDELVRAAAGIEAERLGMERGAMLAYLRKMKRVLGEDDLRGQAAFLDELARYAREPLFRPGPEGTP